MKQLKIPSRQKSKPKIDKTISSWDAGYQSYTDRIRSRSDSFSDMTNWDSKPDGTPFIRSGTIKYGNQPLGKVTGRGLFNDEVSSSTTVSRYVATIQEIDGVGRMCTSIDGGPWNIVGGEYSSDCWSEFIQSNNRVYIVNSKDKLSYYNIETQTLVKYTEITNPNKPTATQAGLSGSVVTYRYKVSANNKVGETSSSDVKLVTVGKFRNEWDPNTEYVNLSWDKQEDVESYNIYVGTSPGNESFLTNIPQPSNGSIVSFKDNNRLPINPFKKAPEGNSTQGPILKTMINSNGQLFGLDAQNPYRLWYSGTGDKSGDFSPYNGGGWVDINKGADSVPTAIAGFRDGRGSASITILTSGSSSTGGIYHMTFLQQTIGDYTINYPSIEQANGESGTRSQRALVSADNSLLYISGESIKTTGTKPQMINVLVSENITDTIEPDLKLLNQKNLHKSVGMTRGSRVYFALPVGSDDNNQIWIYDYSKRGAWILRWNIRVTDMWLYEDSKGVIHHCLLTDNKIVEFSDAATTDDGEPIRTRLSGATITFDKSGMQMASIQNIRMLLLNPLGKISINIYGLNEDSEAVVNIANKQIDAQRPFSGFDEILFDQVEFDFTPEKISRKTKAQLPIEIDVGEVVSQINYDITTENAARATLHSISVAGKIIPGLYQNSGV